jgi:hypothetical protein
MQALIKKSPARWVGFWALWGAIAVAAAINRFPLLAS